MRRGLVGLRDAMFSGSFRLWQIRPSSEGSTILIQRRLTIRLQIKNPA
jgi:hypothetical protein